MAKYRLIMIVSILLVNSSGLCFFLCVFGNSPIVTHNSIPILSNSSKTMIESVIPPLNLSNMDDNSLNSQEDNYDLIKGLPRSAIQEQNTTLLNHTIDVYNASVVFVPNIWGNILGSDIYDYDLYTNGFNDSYNFAGSGGSGASLFTRIGNNGNDFGIYGESTADTSLNDDINHISAGWQVEFPINTNYDAINISFKWRFDAVNAAFDNYTVIGGDPPIILDATPDYQEIRCRIKHPTEAKSFWVGNPVSSSNPNGTVYYRVGPNVVQDEVWNIFEYSFQVDSVPSNNFTLEIGAFLNTREWWNEYFDVWIDDILILGIDNISDDNPPQAIATGLDRTVDITQFEFWADFSEGTWESPIRNVTVFYNQTNIGLGYNKKLNSSLVFQPPAYINNAGYNQTHWQFIAPFNFSDDVSYYFEVYDVNNSCISPTQSITIGDYSAPEITSSIINQSGTGFINILFNVTDWGYGINTINFTYSIDGVNYMNITAIGAPTFQANYRIDVKYGSTFEFEVSVDDMVVGNSRFYSGTEISQMYSLSAEYPIKITEDTIKPVIQEVNVVASSITESRTNVTIPVIDTFGNISEVYLVIEFENGTLHEKYSHVTMEYSGVNSGSSMIYKLRLMEGEALLKLPFNESFKIIAYAYDTKGNFNSSTVYYKVPDILSPRVSIVKLDYRQPGLLRVWVQATDLGSGIKTVSLEVKRRNSWLNYTTLRFSSNRQQYYADINTGWFGNEIVEFRVYATDNENNEIIEEKRPTMRYATKFFFSTIPGLIITECIIVIVIVCIFTSIKTQQLQRLKAVRRKRFDIALDRSERLAYLGEEAIFGFVAAYGQSEDISNILIWEPRLIGHFYQYLKELVEKANNNVSFIMRAKAQDLISYEDFNIERIGCSAVTVAYPVSNLPQQWLSSLTLGRPPTGASQGVLLLILVMREKWTEISHNFREEIMDGMLELKNLIISGEDKEVILKKTREFRLFISGTLEVLDEIETETDEISDDILGDFETEFLDIPDEDNEKDISEEKKTLDNDRDI